MLHAGATGSVLPHNTRVPRLVTGTDSATRRERRGPRRTGSSDKDISSYPLTYHEIKMCRYCNMPGLLNGVERGLARSLAHRDSSKPSDALSFM